MCCARLLSSSPVSTSPFFTSIHPKAALRLSSAKLALRSIRSAWETSLSIHHLPGYLEGAVATVGSVLQENPMQTLPCYPLKPSEAFGSIQGSLVLRVIISTCSGHHSFLPLHFSNYFSDPCKLLASTTPNGKETRR